MNDHHAPKPSTDAADATGTSDTGKENADAESLQAASTQTLASAVMVVISHLIRPPLFPLGQTVATPGAIDLLDRSGTNAADLLQRHQRGDWGQISPADVKANNLALQHGSRLLSAYELGPRNERLWIITEWDRSVTTLLLPIEY